MLKKIAKIGIVPETQIILPVQSDALISVMQRDIIEIFGRSMAIRHVDAGSCNGCELEIQALTNPYYNIEGHGIHFTASPRHADLLLVTGPVSRNMKVALKRTYDAMANPRFVIAIGDCGCTGGIFCETYATCGPVNSIIPVDVYVPGCPPSPAAILQGILSLVSQSHAQGAKISNRRESMISL
jgi:Ni,Fe-hydrogenase III small subunit